MCLLRQGLRPVLAAELPLSNGLNKQQLEEKLSLGKANHEEVLEAGQQAALDMQDLILRIVSQL